MKLTANHDIRDECLWVRVTGQFEPGAAGTIAATYADLARSLHLTRVLCDITLITGLDADSSSLMDRFELARTVADLFSSGLKLALVATPKQLTRDRFEENVMLNRGATVKISTDPQEALDWLRNGPDKTTPAALAKPETPR